MFRITLPKTISALALAAMLLSIAACARSTAPVTPIQFPYAPAISHGRRPLFTPRHLYVANARSGDVTVYSLGTRLLTLTFPATVDQFTTTMALDSSGDLYVSHFSGGLNGAIDVYAPESGARLRTITSGVSYPNAIAFDGADNLYVANGGTASSTGWISVYAPGSTAVQRTITDNIDNPAALAFDAAGNLYVANRGGGSVSNIVPGSVTVYAPGQTTALRTITSGVDNPTALAFDSQGNLYVANLPFNSPNNDSITVIAPSSGSVVRTIMTSANAPNAIALDGSDDLYVEENAATVAEYGPGATTPSRTLIHNLQFTWLTSMVLDGTGDLYVSKLANTRREYGWVRVYPPSGTKAILKLGRRQGVSGPAAMIIGP